MFLRLRRVSEARRQVHPAVQCGEAERLTLRSTNSLDPCAASNGKAASWIHGDPPFFVSYRLLTETRKSHGRNISVIWPIRNCLHAPHRCLNGRLREPGNFHSALPGLTGSDHGGPCRVSTFALPGV